MNTANALSTVQHYMDMQDMKVPEEVEFASLIYILSLALEIDKNILSMSEYYSHMALYDCTMNTHEGMHNTCLVHMLCTFFYSCIKKFV